MSNQQQFAEIQDLNRFTMFTNSPNGSNLRSIMTFGVRDNFPRITVFPNGENKEQKMPIFAGIDPVVFTALMSQMKAIFLGEKGKSGKMSTDRYNRDTKEKELMSYVEYGKDENGICWMAVTNPNRPRIRFDLKMSDWHHFYHADGTQFTEEEGSVLYAVSKVNTLGPIMIQHSGGFREPFVPTARKADAPVPAGAGDFTGEF